MVIGPYPEITLAEARVRQGEAKRKINAGTDLSAEKRSIKQIASGGNKFSAIYQEWYEHKRQVWSLGYANEPARMFRDDILPMIGGLETNEIEPIKIMEVIRRFEERGAWKEPIRQGVGVVRYSGMQS